jgi:hypothetical protein
MAPPEAAGLLTALRADGFALAVDGTGASFWVSPASQLTAARRAALRAHKAELLDLLRLEAAEAAARRRAPHDPRPDLDATQRDAVWWSVLLALTADVHGRDDPRGVYGALHGVRCLGAGLVCAPGGALRIVAGSVPTEEWRAVRDVWLAPHRAAVQALLRAVAGAWRTHAAELEGIAATLRDVHRAWPDARQLSGPEAEALDSLPVVDLRAFLAEGSEAPPDAAAASHRGGGS